MADETASTPPPTRRRSTGDLLFNIALVLAILAALVAWRRARDPHRLWAKQITTEHTTKLDTALTRCFGGATAADVRRLTTAVRGGQMPDPFNRCHSGPMAELMVAPTLFLQTIQNPPTEVYRLRDRHRSALLRLTSSLRMLEREVTRSAGNPSDAEKRDALVRRLEDVTPELEQERRAFEDMVAAARDAAAPF